MALPRTIRSAGGICLAVAILSNPANAQNVVNVGPLDFSAVVQPILAVIGTVIAGLLTVYVPKALAAFQARTKIQLTDQQRATVLGAVRTAAGVIETTLDQGALRLAHVNVTNATVRDEATAAINAVPVAAAALNMTVDGMARMIVGAVDTGAHGVVARVVPRASTIGQTR
jgi:hypothetical protein